MWIENKRHSVCGNVAVLEQKTGAKVDGDRQPLGANVERRIRLGPHNPAT
jgi:hypothetical protein